MSNGQTEKMLSRSALRVLVLDDEPFVVKLLTHILRDLGCSLLTSFDNGQAALLSLGRQDELPDVILLDLNMPEMDGVEFIRNLVGNGFVGSLILVSAEDERILETAKKLAQAHDISVLGYLSKPVKPEELSALIDKWKPTPPKRPKAQQKTYTPDQVRTAIDSNQLVNYYQPKVAVASGEIVGVETLVRWRHPQDGLVFPDQFIGIAETHGLINDLTRAVICGALNQARQWQDNGLQLRIAINISMDNLTSIDFVNTLADQAAAAGVLPQNLILEVTESRLMTDMKVTLDVLARLCLKRFDLSIDDFGTGHSSLTQLRDLPFSELKVDRSFVHGAWANDTDRAIYDASCDLARHLDMRIVAEGVEDQQDWKFLRQTGCELAQGYFIAKPMTAEEIPEWIQQWNARYIKMTSA